MLAQRISMGGRAVPGFSLGALGFALSAVRGDTLKQGEQLNRGDSLVSANGNKLVLQATDGNLVLYRNDGVPLRAWGPRAGNVVLAMQTDGNLVLYVNGVAVWASDYRGHRAVIQDDANFVLYFDHEGGGPEAVWNSETNGGKVYDDRSGFTKAVSSAGSAIKSVAEPLADLAIAPVTTAAAIARGENVGGAIVNHFKDQIKNLKEIAPIAQVVISFVPGVGAGINAAIAAGVALAQGASISDALVAAAKNALPGGPAAAAAFDAAWNIGKAAATGGNIGAAALQSARDAAVQQFGPAAGTAFDTGLALAHGQNVQQALTSGAINLATSQAGAILSALTPQVSAVAAKITPAIQNLPIDQIAKTLGTDVATAQKALMALNALPKGPIGPIGPIKPAAAVGPIGPLLKPATPVAAPAAPRPVVAALPMKPAAAPAAAPVARPLIATLPMKPARAYPPYKRTA